MKYIMTSFLLVAALFGNAQKSIKLTQEFSYEIDGDPEERIVFLSDDKGDHIFFSPIPKGIGGPFDNAESLYLNMKEQTFLLTMSNTELKSIEGSFDDALNKFDEDKMDQDYIFVTKHQKDLDEGNVEAYDIAPTSEIDDPMTIYIDTSSAFNADRFLESLATSLGMNTKVSLELPIGNIHKISMDDEPMLELSKHIKVKKKLIIKGQKVTLQDKK